VCHAPKPAAVLTEVWINKPLNLGIKAQKLRDHGSQSWVSKLLTRAEEAAALADRAKKTARQAEVLSEGIKHLEKQVNTGLTALPSSLLINI
jgi:hypothetical protein